ERIVAESKWYKYTELDYVHHILVARLFPSDRIAEWSKLQHRSLDNLATPEELTKLFDQSGLLNTEIKELIEDYRYYIKFRQQRRPDIWNNRASWSHFQKKET
ncbi:unnamed protein product, partial [marine sediment metagenome]